VVSVYDVGAVGDQVFIAMELVEGETLAAWLASAPRPASEIVRAFMAAGHGLVAAHAAGLAHGDFKPANVLVASDGRVRVGDFGLARPIARDETVGSDLAGTPAYMAPELLAGASPSAAADQFSFCRALADAIAPVPHCRAVDRVIDRGLLADPVARHPSVARLLTALERANRPRMRRVIGGVVVTSLLGAVVAVALHAGPSEHAVLSCATVADPACPAETLCSFIDSPGNACGIAERPGHCIPRPESCTDVPVEPTCGCDGITYPNSCEARRAGVGLRYSGRCAECGGPDDQPCRAHQFCLREPGTAASGTCMWRPTHCAESNSEVCGDDGVSYANRCESYRAGRSLEHIGKCVQR
jgi:hypothetical protein